MTCRASWYQAQGPGPSRCPEPVWDQDDRLCQRHAIECDRTAAMLMGILTALVGPEEAAR